MRQDKRRKEDDNGQYRNDQLRTMRVSHGLYQAGLWFAAAKLDGQEMLFVTAYPNNGWNDAGHPLKKVKESRDAVLADLFDLHIVEFDRC